MLPKEQGSECHNIEREERGRAGPHQPGPQHTGLEQDKQDGRGYGINRVWIGGQVNSNGIGLRST